MPRFFIDTSDQSDLTQDDVGMVFKNLADARAAAVAVLPDLARQVLPDANSHAFVAIVRGEDGRALVQASLNLSVTWLTPER